MPPASAQSAIILKKCVISVDFILIQCENDIIPIEAKAGETVKAAGMKRYIMNFDAETPTAVRLSMKNPCYDGKILNVPLFMTDELKRLIALSTKCEPKQRISPK